MKQSGSEWLHLAAIAAVLLLVLTNIARADGGLRVEGGWVRALPLALPSAGYFTLRNGTRADAVLVKAQSPACGVLSLHKSEFTGGICRMRGLPEVNVPALGAVAFTPELSPDVRAGAADAEAGRENSRDLDLQGWCAHPGRVCRARCGRAVRGACRRLLSAALLRRRPSRR